MGYVTALIVIMQNLFSRKTPVAVEDIKRVTTNYALKINPVISAKIRNLKIKANKSRSFSNDLVRLVEDATKT